MITYPIFGMDKAMHLLWENLYYVRPMHTVEAQSSSHSLRMLEIYIPAASRLVLPKI